MSMTQDVDGQGFNEKGLGIIETIIVCLLISLMFAVLIPRYQRMAREARETALRMGLANIRTSIQLYVMLNNKPPEGLKELLGKRYIIPTKEGTIFNDQYLKGLAMDSEGYPIDPFGNRYSYEPKDGRVSSTTKAYDKW
ncbi:MAG TPA: type II secretion system protein [Nitrospiria bacterium]|nr:type II secretion system protein [Nitrospiria bacterium]